MATQRATREFAAVVQRPLTAAELRAAKTAWRYIERNTQPETGWVNAVDGFPSSTLWDQGAYVFALIAARRLNLIDDAAFLDRARQFLRSTAALPLFEGRLPNKAYNTLTLAQTDYLNNTAAEGIGWSVLDIGRFLAALSALGRQAPQLAGDIAAVTDAWALDDLVRDGELMGAAREGGTWSRLQEGRLGYEQYAARALSLYGIDTSQAIRAADKIRWRPHFGARGRHGSAAVRQFRCDHTHIERAICAVASGIRGRDRDEPARHAYL